MSETFVFELLLKIPSYIMRILEVRFEMARHLYNAVLHESLNRLTLIKESKLYKQAILATDKKRKKELFKQINKQYKFSDYDLQRFAISVKNRCEIGSHLDTHVCQKIASRVYLATSQYAFKKRGKPRYKKRKNFSSIENKSNATGIRWRNNTIEWKGLTLIPIFDRKDPYGVQQHALSSPTKFCRLVRRTIQGKEQYFVQLIKKGKPLIKKKNSSSQHVVGLDIGPSTIAINSEKKASLQAFCQELHPVHLQQRLLQRIIDRSKRAMNPKNYDEKGRVKKGFLQWKKSKKYIKNIQKLSEIFRKLKTSRKRLHGQLANEVIRTGNIIKTEKLSYKGWQKRYGRSIAFRAPSMFLKILARKAENAGGRMEEFSTRTTALSQVCHACLRKEKKSLKTRWHQCTCGLPPVQRDLYSSFLSRFVNNNLLDISQCKKAWPGAQLLLEQAMSRLIQTASGYPRLASFGISQRQSGSFVKDRSTIDKAKDVVGIKPESFGESIDIAVRTSRL